MLICLPVLSRCVNKILVLRENRLHSIPSSLGQCMHLVYLDLSCNFLRSLPRSLLCLSNLKHLHLGYNSFEDCLGRNAHHEHETTADEIVCIQVFGNGWPNGVVVWKDEV